MTHKRSYIVFVKVPNDYFKNHGFRKYIYKKKVCNSGMSICFLSIQGHPTRRSFNRSW